MALFINWFKVDLAPASFTLPTKDYSTWEDSTTARDSVALKLYMANSQLQCPENLIGLCLPCLCSQAKLLKWNTGSGRSCACWPV